MKLKNRMYCINLERILHYFSSSLTLKLFLLVFVFASFSHIYGQKSITVKHIDSDEFNIDGILDEPMWENAILSSDFTEYFPTDTKLVEYQTELRMLYNEEYLYIGIKAYAPG